MSPTTSRTPFRHAVPTAIALAALLAAGTAGFFGTRSSTAFAAETAAAAPAKAAAFRLERIAPKNTLVYAAVDDVPAFLESLKSTATFKTWLDPEVQQFLGGAMKLVRSKIEEGAARAESEIGVDLRELRTFVAGQAAVAVMPPAADSRHPRLLASLDLGKNAERFREMARQLLDVAREKSDGEVSAEPYTYEGVTVQVITLGAGSDDRIYAGIVGSALVISSDENTMNDAIESAARRGAADGGLVASDRFQSVLQRVRAGNGDGESVIAYADVAGAIAAFGRGMSASDRGILEALGVSDVRAVGLASTVTKDGVFDTVFVDAPGEKRGILRLLESSQGPLRTIDTAPEGTLVYFGFHIDPSEVVSEIRRIAGSVDPNAGEEMDRGLAEAREHLGFDPIADIVAALGDEFSFFLRAPKSGMIPDMALVATLRDGAKLERSLARIEAVAREHGAEGAYTHTQSDLPGGGTLHSIRPGGAPFGIELGIDGDTLAVGASSATVRAALSGQGGGLRRDPQFVSGLRSLDARPDSGFGSLAYVNLRDGFSYLYNVASPFLANWRPDADVPIDMALLPSSEALTRHMTPIVQTFRSEPGGFVARSVSPTGNGLVIYATLGAIVLGY